MLLYVEANGVRCFSNEECRSKRCRRKNIFINRCRARLEDEEEESEFAESVNFEYFGIGGVVVIFGLGLFIGFQKYSDKNNEFEGFEETCENI